MNLTDATFESLYKDFLNIRNEWIELVKAISILHDTSSEGCDVRHVGMTASPGVLDRAKVLIDRWQEFANIAEAKRESGVHTCSVMLYSPVPKLISDFSHFTVNRFSATSVKKMRKEDIIRRLKNRLKQSSTPYNTIEAERDVITFSAYPPGTLFRIRISGYNDLFIDFYKDNIQEKRERIGCYGVILDSSYAISKTGSIEWNENTGTRKNESVYEHLKPIRCSVFSGAEVYLLDEVERMKELTKKRKINN